MFVLIVIPQPLDKIYFCYVTGVILQLIRDATVTISSKLMWKTLMNHGFVRGVIRYMKTILVSIKMKMKTKKKP